MSKILAVSFKDCFQDSEGRWHSTGGFPLQMNAIASLFDEMELLTVVSSPRAGAIALASNVTVKALRPPEGEDSLRKLDVVRHLSAYWRPISQALESSDALHVPLPGDLPLIALIVAVIKRRPILARYGGSWQANQQTTLMNRVTRMVMRSIASNNRVMLATGEGATPPAKGMEWIFSTALSQTELAEIQPDLLRGLSSPLQLIYIGRLSPEKGVRVLIDALSKSTMPSYHLHIVGEGPERASLERLVSNLKLTAHISFHGQKSRSALAQIARTCDICVQPSLTEGFSKAWLDAMSFGLPVIASNVGAAGSVIGKHGERGWLVEPRKSEQLTLTLRAVVEQPLDWHAIRQRCREFAESRTLESWSQRIGTLCASAWNFDYLNNKLSPR